jgi:hypothetical protein
MCKTQDKLPISLFVKQIGGSAGCRDRGYQLANQSVLGREAKSRDIGLKDLFAAGGALTENSRDQAKILRSINSAPH